MNGSWFLEENFNGLSDDFFDDVIKYLDFPLEDVEANNASEDWNADFQKLEPPPMDVLSGLSSEFAGGFGNSNVGVQKNIPTLKPSISSEASSSSKSSMHQSARSGKILKLFQSSSPVSVLESSSNSSSSPENTRSHILFFPVKGTRSKRKRPSILKLNLPFASGGSQPSVPCESESETYTSEKLTKKKHKKQKILASLSGFSSELKNSESAIRKCTHCETTKTPQWREGPNGPKTLCNACGVRFRSGRLVPEYRPASSPTFIPSLHSNSHRKIVEMRKDAGQQFDPTMMHVVTSSA